jgi:uncharacterized repeat protein (TIGR04076 family)
MVADFRLRQGYGATRSDHPSTPLKQMGIESSYFRDRTRGGEKMAEDSGYRIVVKVISRQGTCQFGHEVGDTVIFDGETIQGRICLSALYSFLPKVFAMRYGAQFPWLKEDKDLATHACPDAYNPVVFEIRRIRE